MEALYFIFVTPFTEHALFPVTILILFILSLIAVTLKNRSKLGEYRNGQNNYIYEEWLEPISLTFIPSILMSIGIIGTFYLIYSSLSHFDINKVDELSETITNNIAPAFSVSAFGIVMSIIYIFIERFFSLAYTKKMKLLKAKNDNTNTYEGMSQKQLELNKLLLKEIKTQTETFASLGSFSNSLAQASEGMTKFAGIAETLEQTLNPEKLGNIIAKAVTGEIKPILISIQSITEQVNESSRMVNANSNSIKEFLEKDLKNEIMIPLKNSVDNTSESMKQIEQALDKTSLAMIETNKGFDKLNESLAILEKSQENFVQNLNIVLDKQRQEFEKTTETITDTYNKLSENVNEQINSFHQNSQLITESFTGLSKEMTEFLREYKDDFQQISSQQKQAIEQAAEASVSVLKATGDAVISSVNESSKELNNILVTSGLQTSEAIQSASNQLKATLLGVDNALVKTADSITIKLTEFKDAYTDTLKGFLDSQANELQRVFGEHTQKLKDVVNGFANALEEDVQDREKLNRELDDLIQKTNGFVSSTKAMITSSISEQYLALNELMSKNHQLQSGLESLITNATDIHENANALMEQLLSTTQEVSNLFNSNQREAIEQYQIKVDEHLKEILGYMAAIIEASHVNNNHLMD
jgi:hypothetical protein